MVRSIDQFIAIKSVNRTLVFVHASNSYIKCRVLWQDLSDITADNLCVMGDFNVVLGAHERFPSILAHVTPSDNFRVFIAQRDLFEIEGAGNKFTWATWRNGSYMTAKLDRALANQQFLNTWDIVELLVLPMLSLDHNPIKLRVTSSVSNTPWPFRFQEMWTLHVEFHTFVRDS